MSSDLSFGFEEYDTPLPIIGKSIAKISNVTSDDERHECFTVVFDDGSTLLVTSQAEGWSTDAAYLEFDYQEPQVEVLNNVGI